MTAALILSLLLAGPSAPPVSIYVGPEVKDGFVETDQGVRDSIKDIRYMLHWHKKTLRVVDTEDSAVLRLYVLRRSTSAGGTKLYGYVANGSGAVVGAPDKIKRIETVLRTGDYEREFNAEQKSWLDLADQIAKDVAVWLTANRERVSRKQPTP